MRSISNAVTLDILNILFLRKYLIYVTCKISQELYKPHLLWEIISQQELICHLEKEQIKNSLEKGTYVNTTKQESNFSDQILIPGFDYLYYLNLPHLAPTMH